jgi:hypothetical protein
LSTEVLRWPGYDVYRLGTDERAEYFAKPDAKLGTAGDVAVIEFP